MTATITWFLASAAAAAFLDIAQVARATGGEPVLRLAAMVVTLYLLAGAATGIAAACAARAVGADPSRAHPALLALALVAFGLLVGLPYLNIVHLPGIREPITILTNTLAVAAAALAWLLLSRSLAVARLAESSTAALATVVLCVAATAVAGAGRERAVAPPADDVRGGPDVFVVVIDTLRHDRTGSGSPTPNLGRLAARGRTFERAYAQASWTKPSVASLLTSLYPSTHGTNLRRDRLATGVPTLAEVLAARGYRTAVFSANPWISPAFGFDRGVQLFYESQTETFVRLVMLLRLVKAADKALPGGALTTALRSMEEAYGLRDDRSTNCERDVAILDAFARWMNDGGDRPVFAYVHLMSPHIPYDPPGRVHDFAAADQVALLQTTGPLPADRLRLLLDLYDDTIEHADELLGRLVRIVSAAERADDAVIVVTADHGEEFYEHGRWGHGKSLYDEVVRVPLVIVAPGVEPGSATGEPAMLVDVLPTVAGLAGAPPDPRWQGRDLLAATAARAAYAELIREGGLESYMVVRAERKYLETTAGVGQPVRRELYDLRSDPGEKANLAAATTGSSRSIEDLAATLAELRRSAGARSFGKSETVIDDDALRRLEELGYVN